MRPKRHLRMLSWSPWQGGLGSARLSGRTVGLDVPPTSSKLIHFSFRNAFISLMRRVLAPVGAAAYDMVADEHGATASEEGRLGDEVAGSVSRMLSESCGEGRTKRLRDEDRGQD